jgi:hypothetical protein
MTKILQRYAFELALLAVLAFPFVSYIMGWSA